jgi:ACS family tartrate transporter-like MFS transporter
MLDSLGQHAVGPRAATIRKVSRRLIPFLILLYVTAYLDRVNVGFAALEMNADLKFSAAVFGFGSGVFFLGYCLLEVPSNIVLARVGARIWICRIMVSWGIIASAMALVKTPTHFHVLRFLLGAAEAGFFPGVIFYLSRWFPASARARAIASFMIGIPLSGIIGGPLSGYLLNLNGNLGLAGWQWLFLIEGVPPIVLGFVVLWYLTDEPRQADWLSPIERESLESEIAHESQSVDQPTSAGIWRTLFHPRAWAMGAALFLSNTGFFGYLIWSPQIIRGLSGTGHMGTGLISGAINVGMAVAMFLNGAHSDRTRERRWHAVLPMLVMASGFFATVLFPERTTGLMGLALIAIGVGAFYPPYWSFITGVYSGRAAAAAAAAIGLVASIGNSGGFFGPALIGMLKDSTGTYRISFLVLGGMAIASAALTAWLARPTAASRDECRPTSSAR